NAARDELRTALKMPLIIPSGTSASDFRLAGWRPQIPGREPPSDPATVPDPAVAAALAELSDKLRAVVVLDNELNPGQRSAAEIAQIRGINRVTAAMRLRRAYTRLAELLPAGYPEEHTLRTRTTADLEERPAT